MRIVAVDSLSRRSFAAAVTAFAMAAIPRQPAAAIVEGIPLYAPGEKVMLPDAGFETYLPKLETLRDDVLPSLSKAVAELDWSVAAQLANADQNAQQMKLFGSTAALLGDDAYTALSIKARYSAASKRLQRALAEQAQGDAQLLVKEMDASLNEFIGLIPKVVVDQVRAREAKLASFAAAKATPAQVADQPEAAAAAPKPEPEKVGFLITPTDAGTKRCGIDIRC